MACFKINAAVESFILETQLWLILQVAQVTGYLSTKAVDIYEMKCMQILQKCPLFSEPSTLSIAQPPLISTPISDSGRICQYVGLNFMSVPATLPVLITPVASVALTDGGDHNNYLIELFKVTSIYSARYLASFDNSSGIRCFN